MSQLFLFPELVPASDLPIAQATAAAILESWSGLFWDAARRALVSVNAANKAALDTGNSFDGQLFGWTLSKFVWQRVSMALEDEPGVRVTESPRLVGLADETLYLRFKSLRDDGFPWPPSTPRAAKLARQLWAAGPIVTLGVRTSPARDEISRMEVQCLKSERELWWCFGLPEQPAANTQPPAPGAGPDDRPRYTAKNPDALPTSIEE